MQKEVALKYTGDAIAVAWLLKKFVIGSRKKKTSSSRGGAAVQSSSKKKAVFYDGFQDDLRYLLAICFPSRTCKEVWLSVSFVVVLLARTLLSLVVAEVDGYLVKQLINRNKADILKGGVYWLAIALPSSFANALIRYLQQTLALSLRERLNKHIQDMYFKHDSYYKINHHLVKLPGAEEVKEEPGAAAGQRGKQAKAAMIEYPPNTEQAVTEGITQWSDRFADVISSLGKPLFDVTLFTGVLVKILGVRNQTYASICIWESSALLNKVRPNFSQIVQEKNDLESRLRSQHTRIVTNGEEIAFYGGEKKEASLLKEKFKNLHHFTLNTLKRNAVYQTVEDFLTKYVWICIGLIQVAIPLLEGNSSAGDNAKYFISVRRIMTRGGDATERLLQGIKDVGELAGFTKNLMNTIHLLRHLNENKTSEEDNKDCDITESEDILVKDLPLYTPTNDCLIDKMNLHITRKDRLLILGPNGCGKSTLFRVLCGLWTARGGSIEKPKSRTDMLFLPQRPYMVPGTLFDQVIYPLNEVDARARCRERHNSDDIEKVVLSLMEIVDSMSLVELHGGLQSEKDWGSVLSAGEKQRIGLARVLFHRPKYAILDECNSTINIEAETRIFDELVKVEGMGLITISHRHSLFRYHNKFLTYDGCGDYNFHETNQENLNTMDEKYKEKSNLVTMLMECCKDLGESWPEKCIAKEEEAQ